MDVYSTVHNCPSIHKQGLLRKEIYSLLDSLVEQGIELNKERFDDALMGCTCLVIGGMHVIYRQDIVNALNCAIEDRDLNFGEWD